jgi:zinc/manganese transport system substrate-binding protein
VGVLGCVVLAFTGAGCLIGATATKPGVIAVVAAENEYANVISQIGGRYVSVTAILSNPNTDPHTFEASPRISEEVSAAQLVVENGVRYDAFMGKIEAAAPNPKRIVIDVQNLLGLPDTTPNPHLWYRPTTMPIVANAAAADLARLQPGHASFFRANARRFIASLGPWDRALAAVRADFPAAPVAVTEPVADYMLQAAGLGIRTPWSLQADIMNGVDVSPQNVSLEENLLAHHDVKVFLYNEQVTDSVTQALLAQATQAGVPVVAVYETMPTPGYDYQTWMLAEVTAVQRALAEKVSTVKL